MSTTADHMKTLPLIRPSIYAENTYPHETLTLWKPSKIENMVLTNKHLYLQKMKHPYHYVSTSQTFPKKKGVAITLWGKVLYANFARYRLLSGTFTVFLTFWRTTSPFMQILWNWLLFFIFGVCLYKQRRSLFLFCLDDMGFQSGDIKGPPQWEG